MMINVMSHILPDDKKNWSLISNSVSLYNDFIDENSDNLNWDVISNNHKMSTEFMEKHIKNINWSNILLNPSFTFEHLILFIDKFTEEDLKKYVRFKKLSNDQIKKIGFAKKMIKGA